MCCEDRTSGSVGGGGWGVHTYLMHGAIVMLAEFRGINLVRNNASVNIVPLQGCTGAEREPPIPITALTPC